MLKRGCAKRHPLLRSSCSAPLVACRQLPRFSSLGRYSLTSRLYRLREGLKTLQNGEDHNQHGENKGRKQRANGKTSLRTAVEGLEVVVKLLRLLLILHRLALRQDLPALRMLLATDMSFGVAFGTSSSHSMAVSCS